MCATGGGNKREKKLPAVAPSQQIRYACWATNRKNAEGEVRLPSRSFFAAITGPRALLFEKLMYWSLDPVQLCATFNK